MTRLIPIMLTLLCAACTPAYQRDVQITGEVPHAEPKTQSVHTVIGQSAYFAVLAASEGVLHGWRIHFRPGAGSYARCSDRRIYIDSAAWSWRRSLCHEVTHAVLCELRPGQTVDQDHALMRKHGLCP